MKSLIYSLMLVVLMSSVAFAGSSVSFSISFNQPAYQPVYVYPQPVYACPRPVYVYPQPVYVYPQPVYVYPAPAYIYAPVQPGYTVGFSKSWGNRGDHGYYDNHRGNYGRWHGHK